MKRTLIAAILPLMLLAHSSAFADTRDGATRIRALQTQIDYAKRYGNTQQAMNQQIALDRVRANCTDTGNRISIVDDILNTLRETGTHQLNGSAESRPMRDAGHPARHAPSRIGCASNL